MTNITLTGKTPHNLLSTPQLRPKWKAKSQVNHVVATLKFKETLVTLISNEIFRAILSCVGQYFVK